MNPSIGAISKWKYILLQKLWWCREFSDLRDRTFLTFLRQKRDFENVENRLK